MSEFPLQIQPFGERAVLIEWPVEVKATILNDILQFQQYLRENLDNAEEWEMVPAYNSLTLIHRDPIDKFDNLSRKLRAWHAKSSGCALKDRYLWKLPVCYDMEFGIDLPEVASVLGLSTDEVISRHTAQPYLIYGIGFLPGFMYLGGLPEGMELPRKKIPRQQVEKGSVGLAGKQTGIYPQESPGGWNIIGNCPIPIFNSKNTPPCFVKVGDQVQFYPINKGQHKLFKIQAEVGIYPMEKFNIDG